ncbi:futalosine hydrolase [Desulfuromonas sp. KJ2020]|uniref:futalosine hydrolase n=1 Tax=Desulfuromonas sp. KJ2020 TaxID=2919173 RepID=UPI0020A7BF9B|nr:futalosine hydrolase [Desulfuromonas sp. KJ2020]MCP3176091.1 futalosine hydrolase [Desulfuromonas sp. KJ2020]
MIALIAAVPLETELLRQTLSPWEVRQCAGYDLFRGSYGGRSIGLLHCGVGKVNAAAATKALITACTPSLILSFGCGGAYPGAGLLTGDLALATAEIYGDEGVLTPGGFCDMEAIGFPLARRGGEAFFNRFPLKAALIEHAAPLLKTLCDSRGCRFASGPFVTISTCSGTLAAGLAMEERTSGICENMEGAAIAHVCQLHDTPFLEVRGISNLTEDRDFSRWDLRGAAAMAQQGVLTLLENRPERAISA